MSFFMTCFFLQKHSILLGILSGLSLVRLHFFLKMRTRSTSKDNIFRRKEHGRKITGSSIGILFGQTIGPNLGLGSKKP